MKISEETIEAARNAKQIFLPNRYSQPFVAAYQDITGYEVPVMTGRLMSVESNGRVYRQSRGRNIPKIVEFAVRLTPEVRTIGLTGSEWCLESDKSNSCGKITWSLACMRSFGSLALISQAPNDVRKLMDDIEPGSFGALFVTTVFPNIVRRLDVIQGLKLAVGLEVDGGVEGVAAAFNMAAVDLVSTGKTIRKNGFEVVANLMPVYPALVQPSPDNVGVFDRE